MLVHFSTIMSFLIFAVFSFVALLWVFLLFSIGFLYHPSVIKNFLVILACFFVLILVFSICWLIFLCFNAILKAVTNTCDEDDDFHRTEPDGQHTGTDEEDTVPTQRPSRSGTVFQRHIRRSTGRNRIGISHNGRPKKPSAFLKGWVVLEEFLNFFTLRR